MTERNINVFISSKNRDDSCTPYNYKCIFPPGLIECGNNEYIKINIINFNMINTMYNINANNNKFNIITTDLNDSDNHTYNYTIPYGNYSVKDIQDYINVNNPYINITYNRITNKYFYKSLNINLKIYLQIVNSGNYLGFNNDDIILINNTVSNNPLNVVYNNKIIVRATNLNFEVESLENINTLNIKNNFEISNILLWISKTDVAPFAEIRYDNYDGGDSFSYNLYNKSIDHLNIEIKNEYDEFIYDANEWMIAVQFTIYQKDNNEMLKLLTIINSYVREILVMLNIFYVYITRL